MNLRKTVVRILAALALATGVAATGGSEAGVGTRTGDAPGKDISEPLPGAPPL
jgi:hypothetical protein